MFVASEWDAEGRQVDPRDVAPAPLTAFARQQGPRFAAVLSATSTVLDERDQLELLREATGCKATLDWLVCRTVSSLVCKDSIQRREVAQSRSGAPLRPGGGEMMPLGGEGTPLVCEFLVPEVALELCCSEGAARDLIAVSLDLRFRLPSTNATFGGGRLTLGHARVISEVTRCLSEEDALRLDERLAEAATTRTPGRLRVLARRWVAKLCPDSFRRRHQAAVAQRSTAMFATQDGMAAFCLDHQLETLAVIDDQLDAWARQRRSLDPATSFAAHKADAAAHLLLGQHPLSGVPAWGATRHAVLEAPGQAASGIVEPTTFLPARTELRVTMSADVLLGLADETCELEGYGPITADQARGLALRNCGSTTVRRVFTDPADGAVMFLDAQRYMFTTQQKEAILALHPISCFPGATSPGARCDLDHRLPYRHGQPHAALGDEPDAPPPGQTSVSKGLTAPPPGQTVVSNGQPLGRRHHRLKTHGGWTAEVDPEDPHTIVWTTPRGRVHFTRDHDGA